MEEIDLGFEVRKRDKGSLRGYILYDIVSKPQHKETLVKIKNFLSKYYQDLTYKELMTTIKTLFHVNVSQNEIKNMIIGLNLLPKNIEGNVKKFVKKEFNINVSRGLFIDYFDYNTVEKIKLRPYG